MMNWTETRDVLIAAGMPAERLSEMWRPGIDLSGANLSGADLSGANLCGTDLAGADLSGADLSGADLSGADLCGADLSGADLCGADLSEADLSGADLSGADLSGADLSGADGPFVTGSFGRHHAVAAGGYISIGCERHSYAEWLKRYEEIGRVHDYSPAEIEVYGQWIRMAVAWLEPIEAALTAKAAG
jgi:hypothetical protein